MLIDTASYLTFVAACVAILLVPGPTVTVIIANSLRSGVPAGLMNIAGTQVGLAMMLGVLAAGLTTVVATMGAFFDVVRVAGALKVRSLALDRVDHPQFLFNLAGDQAVAIRWPVGGCAG